MSGIVGEFLSNIIGVVNFTVAYQGADYLSACVESKSPMWKKPVNIVAAAFGMTILPRIESYIYDNYLSPAWVYLSGHADVHQDTTS